MAVRPRRPPDKSIELLFPTAETVDRVDEISRSHADPAVRLLAAIVARLCPATEAIGRSVGSVASGIYVSLDEPDIEEESPE